MRPRSISTKLFVVTALFLVAFVTLMMQVQTQVFESYYKHVKMEDLKTSANDLVNVYRNSKDTDLSQWFETVKKMGVVASVVDFSSMQVTFPDLQALMIDGTVPIEKVKISQIPFLEFLTMWIGTFDLRQNEQLLQGNQVVFDPKTKGFGIAVVIPLSSTPQPPQPRKPPMKQIIVVPGKTGSKDPLPQVPLVLPKGAFSGTALVAITSLQPVGEAALVLKGLYVYFVLAAIVIIILLTFLYSRMISKPLVRLNEAAAKMAQLDFTVRCEDRAQDEIGGLSRTLNFLSQNLKDTLERLQAANDQLTEDIAKEKELETLRRVFVASVSHELKTPIALISGYAEGLRDNIAVGKRRDEYVEVILEETGRMANLVTDMLDLSQLEAGKFKLTPAPFNLHELIRATADAFSVTAAQHDVRIDLQLPEEERMAVGDAFRIRQVLDNLVSNAVKHTPQGGRILIGLTEREVGVLQVDVHNEGSPIPEPDIRSIWDTFYKVEKSRSREAGGTGIGLAVVKSILQLHGSTYGVVNGSDGVRFYFTLQPAFPSNGFTD